MSLQVALEGHMRGSVGNTDHDWYRFLLERQRRSILATGSGLEEVNFWKPSGGRFTALSPGEPFFFRLKAPWNAIVGFGFFARYVVMPDWRAWELFGEANGNASEAELRRITADYRVRNGGDPQSPIGCILLSQPTFFDWERRIRQPSDWAPNIVTIKGYDLTVGEGRRIFEECLAEANLTLATRFSSIQDRYGKPILVKPRLGQGTFRAVVTDVYGACAVTGEHSLPVLEAAHIKPFSQEGPHDVRNGILLRSDVHRLFDHGYVTITPEHRFEVSDRLRKDWENGRAYYEMRDRPVHIPTERELQPDPALLQWHNEHVFLG
jgi:putative restriction endonuclease